jgi:hypothetical protein
MSKYLDSELQLDSQLVLCYEHRDNKNDYKSIDNRIFVTFDKNSNDYYICGKRQTLNNRKRNYAPYAFHTATSSDVYDFIVLTIGYAESFSVTLYNFNNIVNSTDAELTYEFFESMMNHSYEISAYDECDTSNTMHQIKTQVKMLKKMYNFQNNNYEYYHGDER